MYFLGINGRGRYAGLLAVDQNGKIVGRHSGATADLRRAASTAVARNVSVLVKELNQLTNTTIRECAGVCFSADASVIPANEAALVKMFKTLGFGCEVRVVSGERAVVAAKTDGPAVLLVAADDVTGFIMRQDGSQIRVGGYGYMAETGGSEYAVGMAALRRVFMAYDGRAESTALTALVTRHMGVKEVSELPALINSDDFVRKRVCELARLVKSAAEQADPAAIQIETAAAHGLADFGAALLERTYAHTDRHTLVMAGVMPLLNESVSRQTSALIRTRYPGVTVLAADEKPETGAALLALRGHGK